MKIIDNVFVIPRVVANPYILVAANGLTVIDAGLPRSEKKILLYGQPGQVHAGCEAHHYHPCRP